MFEYVVKVEKGLFVEGDLDRLISLDLLEEAYENLRE